jgi:hypothetical protein
MTDFSKCPVGTKVASAAGDGEIIKIRELDIMPVTVKFASKLKSFTADGRASYDDKFPLLFLAPFEWPKQEVAEPPTDWSKVPVDTLVWVKVTRECGWKPRYFAGMFGDHVKVWAGGANSATAEGCVTTVYAATLIDPRPAPKPAAKLAAHDYKWSRRLKLGGLHKWFTGVKPDGTKGIAVADDSGEYPHTTDDGVLWLDTAKPMVIEANRVHTTTDDYLRRCPVTVHLLTDSGGAKHLGGTSGYEVTRVYDAFSHEFALELRFESVTDMRDD